MPSFIFEQFINGLTQGRVYALLALGFTLIFGTLRMVNFAHGEVYMMGAYMGFEIIRLRYPAFLLALLVALAATAVLGIVVELLAFHFLRKRTPRNVAAGDHRNLDPARQPGPEDLGDRRPSRFPSGSSIGSAIMNSKVAGVYITLLRDRRCWASPSC